MSRWTPFDRRQSQQAFPSLPSGAKEFRNVLEVCQAPWYPGIPRLCKTQPSVAGRLKGLDIPAKSLLIPTRHPDEFQAELLLDGPADRCDFDHRGGWIRIGNHVKTMKGVQAAEEKYQAQGAH